jgi:hypothetical protein
MAKKDHDRERETEGKYEPEPPHGGPHRGHPGHDEEESGDDAKRHASIIERRWLGSPPPTAERYTNAFRQWRKLPGALPGPATPAEPTQPTDRDVPVKERES